MRTTDENSAEAGLRPEGAALLDELVRRHAREIQLFLHKLCGDHHHAEELAQDVFVKAFRNLDSLRDLGSARRWLFAIAVNHFNDWLRPRRRRLVRPVAEIGDFDLAGPASDRPGSELAARELGRAIAEGIFRLPDRQRRVVLLFSAKGFGYAEIGDALGITPEAAKVNLFHAREKLRKIADRYFRDRRDES
ncbi:MAG: RNA polymerase sigma factor [Planctomycetota bacterium]